MSKEVTGRVPEDLPSVKVYLQPSPHMLFSADRDSVWKSSPSLTVEMCTELWVWVSCEYVLSFNMSSCFPSSTLSSPDANREDLFQQSHSSWSYPDWSINQSDRQIRAFHLLTTQHPDFPEQPAAGPHQHKEWSRRSGLHVQRPRKEEVDPIRCKRYKWIILSDGCQNSKGRSLSCLQQGLTSWKCTVVLISMLLAERSSFSGRHGHNSWP